MQINITIHSAGSGLCSLTGKETDGMTVSFEDGTLKESFLSHKAFRQLIGMKAGMNGKAEPRPTPAAVSGQPVVPMK
jgi:hypothetical protein